MAACAVTGLPLAWEIRPGRDADMRSVPRLLDQLAERGVPFETVAMDKGYDYKDVYEDCERHGAIAVVSKRTNSGTGNGPIDRATDRFKRLYRMRAKVEGEFGRLKTVNGLTPLRSRGLQKVQTHADLCLIARLAISLQLNTKSFAESP